MSEKLEHSLPSPVQSLSPTDLQDDVESGLTRTPSKAAGPVMLFLQKTISRSTPSSLAPPPDGGLTAWTVCIMCHMVGFNTWGFLNSFGILQTFYVSELQRPPSDISWIGSLQAFLMFFISTLSGRMTDAGYFHQVFLVGTVLMLLGIFGASVSTAYWQLLLSNGVCVGIGGGLVFCPAISIAGTYFSRKQALVLAICACGGSTGGLVFSAMFQQLLPKIGFPWAMRIVGFVIALTLIPSNFLIKPRQLPRKPGPMVEFAAFKEPAYTCFGFGMFFIMLGMWFPVYYLGSFGRDIIKISNADAASLLIIINSAGLAGRIFPAILAIFTGPINILVPFSFLSCVLLWSWIGVTDRKGVIIFDVIYGIVMASAQGMLPASLGSLTTDMTKMGVRMGMVFTIVSFALLIGTPIAGALIERDDGVYLYAQVYAAMSLVIGTGLLAASRLYKTGWKLRVRA